MRPANELDDVVSPPPHANRVPSLLREPRIIDGENAGAHGHDGAQVRPDALGIPRRMRDEVLQRLILARIAQPAMHRLHGLALAVVEQAVEILAGRVPLRLPTEARAESIQELAQAPQQRPCGPRRHAGSVRDSARQYKCDLTDRGSERMNLTK